MVAPRALLTGGLAALLLAGGLAALAARSAPDGSGASGTSLERLDTYGRVPEFALTERSGRRVGRDDLRGFVWVVDFVYTECTESCPLLSLEMSRLQAEFADADLRLVSITVDPRHDSPAVLRRYAERYGASPRWLFLTGDTQAIYCLASRGFHLSVVDQAATAPIDCGATVRLGPARAWASHGSRGLIVHSDRVALVDRAARIRAYHRPSDPESLGRLRANLRRLLAKPRP